jgi:hypothetical protein
MAPSQNTRLVAVYDSEQDARSAVEALQRVGVTRHDLRIADPRDRIASVKGEMRSEVNNAFPGPLAAPGPHTKEMSEGSLLGLVLGGVVGALLLLPFAAVFGGMVWWGRVIIVVVVGIFVGSTLGWVIGGGFGAKRPDEQLAAESGVTLAVPASEAAREVLTHTHPRRIDLVAEDGRPVSTIDERSEGPGHIMRDIGRHMGGEDRQDG